MLLPHQSNVFDINDTFLQEEYDDAMRIMDNYYLDRENLEALSDLHVGPKKPMSQLSAKAKTTFTKLQVILVRCRIRQRETNMSI